MKKAVYDSTEFKALNGNGEFEAYVSVFGNVDLVGDKVMPGAFKKSLTRWKQTGDPIPVIFSHDWEDPFKHIGTVDPSQAVEDKRGLRVRGRLDIEEPLAAQVFKLLQRRSLKEWSFAYDVNSESPGPDGENQLKEVDLIEVGPTLKGANPLTGTVAAKALHQALREMETKGGSGAASDDSEWSGSAALASCESAADFRAVCAGERSEGEPDQRQHWALPHHKSPGAPANADGVAAARQRFDQTEGLVNAAKARTHLFETHTLPSDESSKALEYAVKVGRAIAAKNETKIRAAISMLEEVLSSQEDEGSGTASQDGKAEEPQGAKVEDRPVLAAYRAKYASLWEENGDTE